MPPTTAVLFNKLWLIRQQYPIPFDGEDPYLVQNVLMLREDALETVAYQHTRDCASNTRAKPRPLTLQQRCSGTFPAFPILTKAPEIRIVRGLSNDVLQESFLGKFSTSNQARTAGRKTPPAEHQSAVHYAHFY
jgi:hypothetical protein